MFLWFYLFGQGVPNETKGVINLKFLSLGSCVKKIAISGPKRFVRV